MKVLRVAKIVKEIKFEGVLGELESKKLSRDNYLKLFESYSSFDEK